MIGLDTNVLVRYIMQDDARQSELASRLIESLTVEEAGFLPLVATIELVWVLSSSFELVRSQIVSALEVLCRLQVEGAEVVQRAIRLYRNSSADFVDCLIE